MLADHPTMRNPEPRLSVLTLTTPVAMGYVPLGAVFGFLFVQAGGAWWLGLLTSVVVYAGASQYMMIPMLASGLPLGTIAAATLVINLRHVFYGLSLLDCVPRRGPLRWLTAYTLTDETYSVLTALPAHTSAQMLVLLSLLNQGWWVLGTALGVLLGARVQLPWEGLDFILTALFAVLLVEQWRNRTSTLPLWVGLGGYALGYWAWNAHALVTAIGLSVAAALLSPSVQKTEVQP